MVAAWTSRTAAVSGAAYALVALLFCLHGDPLVHAIWKWLRNSPVFAWQYFEAVFPVPTFGSICLVFLALDQRPELARFRVSHSESDGKAAAGWTSAQGGWLTRVLVNVIEALVYISLPGVIEHSKSVPRALRLPEQPPTAFELLFGTLANLLLYDALFFFSHVALHSIPTLYRCATAPVCQLVDLLQAADSCTRRTMRRRNCIARTRTGCRSASARCSC